MFKESTLLKSKGLKRVIIWFLFSLYRDSHINNSKIDITPVHLEIIEKSRKTNDKFRNILVVIGTIITTSLFLLRIEFFDLIQLLKSIESIFSWFILPLLVTFIYSFLYDYYCHKIWKDAMLSNEIKENQFNRIKNGLNVVFFINIFVFLWVSFILYFIYILLTSIIFYYSQADDIGKQILKSYSDSQKYPETIKNLNLSKNILQKYTYINKTNYYELIFPKEMVFDPNAYFTNKYIILSNEVILIHNPLYLSNLFKNF
jgi:hypothetical protein